MIYLYYLMTYHHFFKTVVIISQLTFSVLFVYVITNGRVIKKNVHILPLGLNVSILLQSQYHLVYHSYPTQTNQHNCLNSRSLKRDIESDNLFSLDGTYSTCNPIDHE